MGKIIGILNKKEENNLELSIYLDFLKLGKPLKKIIDSFKILGLDNDILNKTTLEISKSEYTKLKIAKELIKNKKEITLDHPTEYLDTKSKNDLIKLIKMMKLRYNKTIIILSEDTIFLHKLVDYVIIMDGEEIVFEGSKYEAFSNEELLKKYNLKMPDIIYFSKLVKKMKNINIGFRDEITDLMKDIYRFSRKEE